MSFSPTVCIVSLGPGTSALTPTIVDPPRVPARVTTVRKQFDARAARFGAHDALVREVGRRMVERFELIRFVPERIADVGCGAGGVRAALRQRFPRARWVGIDLSTAMLARGHDTARGSRSTLRRWFGGSDGDAWICADAAQLPLADGAVDLVFSNLMPHWHPRPHTLFPEWKRVLRTDGLLMFSTFGPDTLKELRAAVGRSLPAAMPMPFVDMHDFGDMLVAAGFATPVMDVEILRLTYTSPRALLRELRALGGNARDDRPSGLPSTAQVHALLAALDAQRGHDGRIGVTFEVAYGHAWRPALPAHAKKAIAETNAQTAVSLAELRAQLRETSRRR
ncbi:MAG TPA: methyltransferase domain-containing protein [Burkholderiaceae bacterium]|nr:methyltransferase domain-containing protein [Burkholderiaceae bacterium]